MLKIKIKFIFILIFLCYNCAFGYEPKEGNINAGIGFFLSQTNIQKSSYSQMNPIFGGFSLIVEGDVNSSGSLEIDLSYFQKMFYRESNSKSLAEKTEIVSTNMGYRYWIFPKFSMGLGLSSLYSVGEKDILYSQFAVENTIDTSASNIVKYGLELSLQYEMWSNEKYSTFFDARYNYSLSNKDKESGDHFLYMIELKTPIQSK